MSVAFTIRAAFRGDRILLEVMLHVASGEAAEQLAAKPPLAAAEPLSLLLRVRLEGLLSVAKSDIIVDGGE